jgi:hypothetical protein
MAVRIPNTSRIRASTDSTVAGALNTLKTYINQNVTPKAGTARPAPVRGSRPIHPVP